MNGRFLGLGVAVALCGVPPTAAAQTLVLEDPLTSSAGPSKTVEGGSFSSAGWTRSDFDSRITYDLGRSIVRGRVSFEMDGVNGTDHGVGGNPPCRAIFAALDADGSGNLGPQNIWVWAMDNTTVCNGSDTPPFRTNRMKLLLRTLVDPEPGEPMSDELDWDPSRFYRYEVSWDEDRGTLSRDGVEVLDIAYPGGPLQMQMRYLFLGTIRRYRAGVKDATYRNLEVWDLGGGAVPPPIDGGAGCLQGVSLDPPNGSGSSVVLRATYSNCHGADAFRIVQIWIGEAVDVSLPRVAAHYEAGRFSSAGDSCVPGEAKIMATTEGSFDCARSTVSTVGDRMTVEYAFDFEPSEFSGLHRVFFDAKGGPGDPEPRLGWTEVGTFEVTGSVGDASVPDAGVGGGTAGASSGSGGSSTAGTAGTAPGTGGFEGFAPRESGDSGCGCRAARGGAFPGAALVLGWLVGWRARRRLRPRRFGSGEIDPKRSH